MLCYYSVTHCSHTLHCTEILLHSQPTYMHCYHSVTHCTVQRIYCTVSQHTCFVTKSHIALYRDSTAQSANIHALLLLSHTLQSHIALYRDSTAKSDNIHALLLLSHTLHCTEILLHSQPTYMLCYYSVTHCTVQRFYCKVRQHTCTVITQSHIAVTHCTVQRFYCKVSQHTCFVITQSHIALYRDSTAQSANIHALLLLNKLTSLPFICDHCTVMPTQYSTR